MLTRRGKWDVNSHINMLAHTLAEKGIRDPRVLAAVRLVDRARFVPLGSEHLAGRDRAIAIPQGQLTTQPWRAARMLEALELRGTERVLEIGTGHGYSTALCAHLARRVVSVERIAELVEACGRNLAGFANIRLVLGDGSLGCPDEAPYDASVCFAAARDVPACLVEQLAIGGRMVLPLAVKGRGEIVLFRKTATTFERVEVIIAARFVPLIGEHGAIGG
jgi:protein-L-isoaspartate(D-aspartate) O-methyltransferase